MIGVTVVVHSLFMGSAPGAIHMVVLPCHFPASFASRLCGSPGVPAIMQACMSASVHPGGSFISGCLATWPEDLASVGDSLLAQPATVNIPAAAMQAIQDSFLTFIGPPESVVARRRISGGYRAVSWW